MKISSVDFLCKLRECSVWIATFFIRKGTLGLRRELKWFSSYPCVKNIVVYTKRRAIMLYFVCNMHEVSSVCTSSLCVPLYAFQHPHMRAVNIFSITLSNVPTFCSKRLLVYCLVSICQHFAMFFSGAKISRHGYFFCSSNKRQDLYKRETRRLECNLF